METVLVLDFGGQYKELIARTVREAGVYSEILPCTVPLERIKSVAPVGIILTGGPDSVDREGAPTYDKALFSLGIPILGICYGAQLTAYLNGGKVSRAKVGEYGVVSASVDTRSALFHGLDETQKVLMSHTDCVSALPEGFRVSATTENCVAAFENAGKRLYAVQFHPEVETTENGRKIISNFLFGVCKAKGGYEVGDYAERKIKEIREQVGDGKVLLALSGGVDSSVCAALLDKALGDRLYCIFVDHGLMRLNEGDEVEKAFSGKKLNFIRVNAEDRFLAALAGVTEPEKKRKIIGKLFLDVFEEEARKLGKIDWFAQGTIYPDVIESGALNSATIKSHHNVGGLPSRIDFKGIIEPLRGLFKDEVRRVGRGLGLPGSLVSRQPFPGPGLAVRVVGEITKEKLDILRAADAVFREEMKRSRVKSEQYFAVLTGTRSVGVMGDHRTYDYTVALRAVNTSDFMTCVPSRLSYSLLTRTASRIVNEVKGVNRVVYDVTGKPPATVEWE